MTRRKGNDAASDAQLDRPKYVPSQPAANDAMSGIIMVTPGQLSSIVRSAVADAFAARVSNDVAAAPLLLDRNGVAKALGCSASQVDRLRKRGLPTKRFGDCPRFELVAVLDWIREQKAE